MKFERRNKTNAAALSPVYREGDEIVLSDGSHQGTLGVFLRLREDVRWADITERNGVVRSHPVVWLALSTEATPCRAKKMEYLA